MWRSRRVIFTAPRFGVTACGFGSKAWIDACPHFRDPAATDLHQPSQNARTKPGEPHFLLAKPAKLRISCPLSPQRGSAREKIFQKMLFVTNWLGDPPEQPSPACNSRGDRRKFGRIWRRCCCFRRRGSPHSQPE
jgi:hypothetical protein